MFAVKCVYRANASVKQWRLFKHLNGFYHCGFAVYAGLQ